MAVAVATKSAVAVGVTKGHGTNLRHDHRVLGEPFVYIKCVGLISIFASSMAAMVITNKCY